MALHLMLRYHEQSVDNGTSGLDAHFAHLSEYDNDLRWTLLADVLFSDHDILELFDPGCDGTGKTSTTSTEPQYRHG